MDSKPKYEELVEILGRHIYDHWTENNDFYDMSNSGFQIAAAILGKLDIMERKGNTAHHKFLCEPKLFRAKAIENKKKDVDTIRPSWLSLASLNTESQKMTLLNA